MQSRVDQQMEDTKEPVQHLREVVADLTAWITMLKSDLYVGGDNTCITLPQNLMAPKPHNYRGSRDAKELKNFL